VKPDGERCKGRARPGSTFCTFHDPALATEQRRARQAGGRKRSARAAVLSPDGPDFPLTTVPEVVTFLACVANATAKGLMDPKVGNSTTQTLAVLLRAIQPDELASQVEEMRQEVAELKRVRHGDGDATAVVNGAPARGGQPQGVGRNGAGPGPLQGRPGAADGGRGLDPGRLADDVAPLKFD
jgi:hypothetical protein